ncbi:glycosyltransferase [Flavobacteriaceae bacterium XHP0103]|uniref:glycosyltransferase family 2 protein n=1 Tax=Marixanthotalea marina TaxID=2844359 RepID=UPI002989A6E0|nr:glycosyltransferase [Marixanthotalea marina]MBU3822747.1 glycosyltransferase [Marixanthotalea marina]
MSKEPLVSISVVTYNHKDYIEQCLEGILMQQTTFPFEIILGEDESNDGTRDICIDYAKKYPDKIRLFLRSRKDVIHINGNPTGRYNFTQNLKTCQGKYIAVCEGDDYWADPLKLQKQVDFLEVNEDYSICWTKYSINKRNCIEDPEWFDLLKDKMPYKIDLNNIFVPYCTQTLTVLFRRNSYDDNLIKSLKYFRDNTLYVICLNKGKGIVLDFNSAIYNIHTGGIYSSLTRYKQKYASYLNLKEIIEKIPNCNTSNILTLRNHFLVNSVELYPKHLSLNYFYLVIDCMRFLKLKKNLTLFKRILIRKWE